MEFMLYPTFEFIKNRGLFPNITLPENYKSFVPNFYKQRRKDIIEKYSKSIEETLAKRDLGIKLKWDNEKGLTNISIGFQGGLDLSEQFHYPHFAEHNLGTETSIISGIIAMKYISELLKSQEIN